MKFQVFAQLEFEADSVDELVPVLEALGYGQRDQNRDSSTARYLIADRPDAQQAAALLNKLASVYTTTTSGDFITKK